ncbi:MAG: hypothetical protein CL512_04785 [Actinobacteria bacterium]|nr:hypothetical protein [Actinomycetota bacterium]
MKPRHSLAGLLGLIVLLSTPVTWLTSMDEPGFVVGKLILGCAALLYWGRALFRHHGGRVSGRGGVHLWVSIQWVLALLVAGSALVGVLHQRAWVWDLTSDHVYTIAPETQALIDQTDEPIIIEAFFAQGQGQARVLKNLVDQLRSSGADIEFEIIDPMREPKRAQTALIKADSPKIIIRYKGRETRVRLPTEQQIAQGISRVVSTLRQVFVLKGHGEPELVGEDSTGYARLARELSGEGLQLAYLDLAKQDQIPHGAEAVIWLHPKTALLEKELEALNLYLDTGGRLLVATQAGFVSVVNTVVGHRGLVVEPGVVVDPDVSGTADVQGKPAAMIAAYTDHPVVARLAASGLRTLFRQPAPIGLRKSRLGSVQPLAAASPDSWIESDPLSRVWQKPKEVPSPSILAAVWSQDSSQVEVRRSHEARIALIGDATMMNNAGLVHAGNRNLMLNMMTWLTSDQDQLEITASERRVSRLFLTRKERSRLRLMVLDLLPLMILLPGLIIWRRRQV